MTSSRSDLPADVDFEPEFLAALHEIYEEKIVFNHWMGLRVESIKATGIVASLVMKPELVGHFAYNRIHGGVISAVLDAMGSLAVMAAMGAKHMDEPVDKRLERFTRHSTIDLRIDFLRPGIGERFVIHAEAMRVGAKVGNARMEFRSLDGKVLSTGTAAYLTS
jgi:uncharacterized protein (TIGR00369 family)